MADDGLEWMLQLDAKIDGARAFLSKLDSIDATLKKLDGKLGETTKATGDASDAHKRHGKEAEKLGGIFQRLTSQALHPFLHQAKQIAEFEFIREGMEKLIEAPFEIMEGIKELGEEMLMTAAKAERTEASFKLLFGDKGGSEALEDIDAIGEHTEFAHDRIKALTQDLGKVGFEGMDLKRARAAALDIAAFSSNAGEGLASAEGALERIKRTGRVDNRTLGGLGIGEKDFLGELAIRTGKSAKTLKKEMDAGKVNAEDSLEALYTVITKKTGKKLGGAGADIAEGTAATLTHLGELPERYFEKLAHSTGFAKFGEQLKHLLDELDPDSPTGKRVFGALEGAFDSIGDMIGHVDVGELVTDFASAFTEIASDVKPAVHVLEEVWDVIHKIGIGLSLMGSDINTYIIKPIETIDGLMKNNRGTKAVEKALGVGEGGDSWIHRWTPFGFAKDVGDGKYSENAGKQSGAGYQKGLMSTNPKTAAAAADVGFTSADALESSLGVQSPSKVFRKIGEFSGDGFTEGLRGSHSDVTSAAGDMVGIPDVAASGTGGGGRSVVMSPTINVHIPAGTHNAADVKEAARQGAALALSEFQSAFDSMAVQAGAS